MNGKPDLWYQTSMRSFITASTIAKRLCSPSRDGQELLPQLVAKLIKNSVPKEAIQDLRFPHSDQVYMHGEDGVRGVLQAAVIIRLH